MNHTRLLSVMLALGAVGCKVRTDDSALRDSDVPAGPSGVAAQLPTGDPDVTGASIATASAAALTGAMFGAGALTSGSCFSGAAAWSDPGTPAFQTPDLVPPGTLRLVRPGKVTSSFAGWNRTVSSDDAGLEVFDGPADDFGKLLDLFGSSDPTASLWHQDRAFGRALAAALVQVPAGTAKYGVVVMRRILANQQLAGDAGSDPGSVGTTASAYGRCGDSYVSGQVAADNVFVMVAAPQAAARDGALGAVKAIALSLGDLDANLGTLNAAVNGGAKVLVLQTGDAGLALTGKTPSEMESVINTWRNNAGQPTGIRSLLAVATPYAAFPATTADPSTAQLGPALRFLATGRDNLRRYTGDAQGTAATQLQALGQAIQDCGGRRFATDAGPAAACTQLTAAMQTVAPPTPNPSQPVAQARIYSSLNGRTFCTVLAGDLTCWGQNKDLIKIPEADRHGIADLAMGNLHICTLKQGLVKCWAYYTTVPAANLAVPDGMNATQIASDGMDSTCAVAGGALQCWGSDDLATIPSDFPNDHVSVVTSGSGGYCAIRQGGVACWGDTGVKAAPSLTGVTAIGVGRSGVAVTPSGVTCWPSGPWANSLCGDGVSASKVLVTLGMMCILDPQGKSQCKWNGNVFNSPTTLAKIVDFAAIVPPDYKMRVCWLLEGGKVYCATNDGRDDGDLPDALKAP